MSIPALSSKPARRVVLGLPSYEGKSFDKHRDCVERLREKSTHVISKADIWGDGIARARNNIAAHFLTNTDGEFLFFIDTDIIFSRWHVDDIVDRNLPICGGLYPKKQGSLAWVMNPLPGEEQDPVTLLQKMRHLGTGFLCIRRDVLEAMIEKLPDIAYGGDPDPKATRWDFFPMHARGGVYLSEDWYFCDRARELGYDINCDTRVQLGHRGYIDYPLHVNLTKEELLDALHWKSQCKTDAEARFTGYEDVLEGCYDIAALKVKPGEKPPTIVDLGANIGAFAYWASHRFPGCLMYCYEPHPQNFQRLKETVAMLPKETGFSLLEAAVGGSDREALLRDGKNNCGECSLHDIGEQLESVTKVGVIDAHTLPAADLLKIDTEGCEVEILQRLFMTNRLPDFRAIVLEYHSEADRAYVHEMLTVAGFTLCGVMSRVPNRGVLRYVHKTVPTAEKAAVSG